MFVLSALKSILSTKPHANSSFNKTRPLLQPNFGPWYQSMKLAECHGILLRSCMSYFFLTAVADDENPDKAVAFEPYALSILVQTLRKVESCV